MRFAISLRTRPVFIGLYSHSSRRSAEEGRDEKKYPRLRRLKKGLKMVIMLLLLPLALLLVPASHAKSAETTVVISGSVSNPTFGLVTVRASASGSTSSLVGAGTDSPPFPGVLGNPGACKFPLMGSVVSGTVALSGSVTQSSISGFVGASIVISAVSSTGFITFIFAGFTFTGTGTVAITTA